MLDLPEAPLRIECVDISHLGGEGVVGSLVVFEDGAPRPRDYRSYTISDEGAIDDTRGRFRPRDESASARNPAKTSAYPPQLLVIDGGAPQVAAASRALTECGMNDVPVVGLAKRLEEVWRPDDPEPLILPRTSEGLFMLQRIRDEAHRTALRHQRRTRSRKIATSALDSVSGLGPAKQRQLLRSFGSVKRIREATIEQLQETSGIGPELAQRIHDALGVGDMMDAQAQQDASAPGEVIDGGGRP